MKHIKLFESFSDEGNINKNFKITWGSNGSYELILTASPEEQKIKEISVRNGKYEYQVINGLISKVVSYKRNDRRISGEDDGWLNIKEGDTIIVYFREPDGHIQSLSPRWTRPGEEIETPRNSKMFILKFVDDKIISGGLLNAADGIGGAELTAL